MTEAKPSQADIDAKLKEEQAAAEEKQRKFEETSKIVN